MLYWKGKKNKEGKYLNELADGDPTKDKDIDAVGESINGSGKKAPKGWKDRREQNKRSI